jgi:Flp pilus assembly protein TadD
MGGVLSALDRSAEALLAYQHVLKLDPRHWEAAYHSGLLLHHAQRFEEALVQFDLSDACRPDHAATLAARARTLRSLKQFERCLADNKRAQTLDPGNAVICNNIGDALLQLDRHKDALTWFDTSLKLQPDLAEVLVNRGFALIQLHRFDEALETYRRARELDPDNAKAAYHLSHLQLLTGDTSAGWALREARWRMPEHSAEYPKFSQPKWLGHESIEGKTVLVHFDEGLGDTIQFARYAPLLAARGARVVLVVQDALHPLMSGLPGVAECLPASATSLPSFDLPAFDFHCPTMTLPLAFGTTTQTIPPANYLPPVAAVRVDAWNKRLGAHDRLRVGLVWSGNPKQGNDRNRSMPLQTLMPLLDLDARFISLQKDVRLGDQTLLRERADATLLRERAGATLLRERAGATLLRERADIIDLTADCTDFVETAALVANVDVVVTVCTSVAHLAATMGRPTWVLLPYVPDWRWLLKRDDSPWYPSVRLFRQDETRDYAGVVARLRAELINEIAKFDSSKSGQPRN